MAAASDTKCCALSTRIAAERSSCRLSLNAPNLRKKGEDRATEGRAGAGGEEGKGRKEESKDRVMRGQRGLKGMGKPERCAATCG
eukprot:3606818-Rhodomonas_salina.1